MKKKQNLFYFIIIFMGLSINYLYSQENIKMESQLGTDNSLTERFMNKTWILDSVKSESMEKHMIQLGKWDGKGNSPTLTGRNQILKPIEGGEFAAYRDNLSYFNSYKISNDTIYLRVTDDSKFQPFAFEKLGEYSYRALPLEGNSSDKIFYYTDVTDLFNGTVVNKGELYNKTKGRTWYPIKHWKLGELAFDTPYRDYYITDMALEIEDNRLVTGPWWGEGTIVKFTEKAIYFFETKTEHIETFSAKIKDNELELIESSRRYYQTIYRKIAKNILQDRMSLPKNVRLNCNEAEARTAFETMIKGYGNSEIFFDLKTIRLTNKNEEDCIYKYSIIVRNKDDHDDSLTVRWDVIFTEEGKISFVFLD